MPYGALTGTDDVERLIRNVIVERGFGCTLLAVSGASTGWHAMMCAGTGNLVRRSRSTLRSVARVAIEEVLEASL